MKENDYLEYTGFYDENFKAMFFDENLKNLTKRFIGMFSEDIEIPCISIEDRDAVSFIWFKKPRDAIALGSIFHPDYIQNHSILTVILKKEKITFSTYNVGKIRGELEGSLNMSDISLKFILNTVSRYFKKRKL